MNHDLHFVDPTTGVHTNTLFVCVVYTGAYTKEGTWAHVKKLKGGKVAEDALGRVRANVAVLSHGKKAVKSTFIHK